MMRKTLFGVILGTLLVLSACRGNGNSTSTANDKANATLVPVPAEFAGLTNPLGADAATQGAEVFRANCEMCHGPQGHGDGPAGQSLQPPPGNLAQLQTRAEDDYLFWRIHEGKPGTGMLAWKNILTEEQIWQAVSFIRTLK
jgi:mono/diheme cytochrome c family protein